MNNLDKLPKKNILSLFMTCGFPSLNQSKKIFENIQKNKPEIIEFGLPFSDPMADGQVIQKSNKMALDNGLTTKQSLNLIKLISKNKGKTSYVVMCYLNTILNFGIKNFVNSCKGFVDGIIIVDLPYEEETEIKFELEKNNIYLIKLISPMTNAKRSKKLLRNSNGFIYYISSTGITGTNKLNYREINKNIKTLKKITDTPILVGFGVKTKKDVLMINTKTQADGVIVGSAMIQMFFDLNNNLKKYIRSLDRYIKSLKIN